MFLSKFFHREISGISSSFFKQRKKELEDIGVKYVQIANGGDCRTCPMCTQLNGKYFLISDAPELPLCPSCRCILRPYFEEERSRHPIVISRSKDFVLPDKSTARVYDNQKMIQQEEDIQRKLKLCEEGLRLLPKFMRPYVKAGFPAPKELDCRDVPLELYLRMGDWENARRIIQICMAAKAYYPESGEEKLTYLQRYSETAETALAFLREHPGFLQRDMYKALCPPLDRELLKYFTRWSLQIRKEPEQKTNRLYVATDT